MGTNFYIDEEKEGVDDYSESYAHLGKRYYSSVVVGEGDSAQTLRCKKFIYYISRNHVLNTLNNLINSNSSTSIIDEYGNRMSINEFLEEIYDLPYEEKNYEFI